MNKFYLPHTRAELPRLLGIAALYCLAAIVVDHYFVTEGRASMFYLASGVALAAILIGGPRYFWAVFLGALVKSLLGGVVWWAALGSALGSALAALVGAWLIRRNGKFNANLPSLHDLWSLVFWGAAVPCLISAAIGSTTLLLRGVVRADDFLQSLVYWWMGDAFGVVLLTPLLLVWWTVVDQKHLRPSIRQIAEAMLIFALTAMAGGMVFLEWGHNEMPMVVHLAVDEIAQGYWMFLFVAWTALRLGQRGTTLVLFLIAVMGAAGVVQGTGFFRNSVSLSDMTGYWFYNLILAMVGMTLATYVTANKRAVERLARSEAKISLQYTNALHALDQHAIVATTDVQGRILSANDKFCEISGYTREELLGQDHAMLSSGTHGAGFFKAMYRTLASGESWHAEVCNRAKDGHLYWLQTTVTPFMDGDGKPTVYVAIRTDITGRRQTELKLAEREEVFRSIVTQATDGIALIDPVTQRFFEFNDALCDGLGYSREEFAQLRLADIQGDLDEDGLAQRVLAVVAAGYASFDTLHRKKNGALRNSHTNAKAIHIGGRTYIASVVSDNTARIQAQEALEQAKEFLEQIVARVPGCMYQFKLESNGHFSAPYASEGLLALYGLMPEQVRLDASAIFAAVHPEDLQAFMDSIQRSARDFSHWNHEYRIIHADGSTRWIAGDAEPQRGEEGSALWHGFITDITERRALDSELANHRNHLEDLVAQKTAEVKASEAVAHAANSSKSEFLANMSHEIRTPMNGVIGMVDILQQTALQPEQARMLDTIHGSSMALLSILNDILDFSKIEAGKLEVESVPTNLREVTESVAQLMLNVASSKGAQVSLFIDPALPTWVLLDPTRLRQVLFNLLGNALKFIPKGVGRAMLHVHPMVRPDGVACVQFSIIDNGIGMDDEVVAKLFQPFTQADASTARKFGGTGLGLSITHRLVEMMHGRILVTSTPGVGSEFMVEFPLQDASAPSGRSAISTPDLSGVRVLAVTPLAPCSTLFQVYLGAAGARVHVVPDLAMAHAELARMAQMPGETVLLLDLENEDNDGDAHPNGARTPDTPWPAGVRVVRLVNRVDRQEPASDEQALETRVLARPLLFHDLIHAVAVASGRVDKTDTVQAIERRRSPRFEAPSLDAAAQTGRLILVAEDNETNRDVIREQLRLLGYACVIANDGAQALQMWQSGRYALLLTDCHMPNMDGFELTEAIRQGEPQGARLPIIAITANAMQGEAQRCRERGMDDYLSKPLRLAELGPMLAKWMPAGQADAQSDVPTPALAPEPSGHDPRADTTTSDFAIWDSTTLNDLVGDNPAMHKRLLAKFLVNAQEQLIAIGVAAEAGDANGAAAVAHTLKSAARSVGALALGELCQAIETVGANGDTQACVMLTKQLPAAFAAAEQAIKNHHASSNAPAVEPSL